jgi:hypothetical protein
MWTAVSISSKAFLLGILLNRYVFGFIVGSQGKVARYSLPTTTTTTILQLQVDLDPEPSDGQEILPRKPIPDTRVKKLELQPSMADDNGSPVYKFWIASTAEGSLIAGYRTQILKDASKKANFPGFRKGQVPPYAQPQITQFAVQEGIVKTIETVVDAYGLVSLRGSDGEVKVNENVSDMAKGWKSESLQFTATLLCGYPTSLEDAATNQGIVDVEAETLSTEATSEAALIVE